MHLAMQLHMMMQLYNPLDAFSVCPVGASPGASVNPARAGPRENNRYSRNAWPGIPRPRALGDREAKEKSEDLIEHGEGKPEDLIESVMWEERHAAMRGGAARREAAIGQGRTRAWRRASARGGSRASSAGGRAHLRGLTAGGAAKTMRKEAYPPKRRVRRWISYSCTIAVA
jgi:hypothetical protein